MPRLSAFSMPRSMKTHRLLVILNIFLLKAAMQLEGINYFSHSHPWKSAQALSSNVNIFS